MKAMPSFSWSVSRTVEAIPVNWDEDFQTDYTVFGYSLPAFNWSSSLGKQFPASYTSFPPI